MDFYLPKNPMISKHTTQTEVRQRFVENVTILD